VAAQNAAEINDFLAGDFVKSFTDGETRIYEFDVNRTEVVSKNDYNGQPTKALRYHVRDVNSMAQSWKVWDLSRMHRNIYKELTEGNNGKGWKVMKITRDGLMRNTKYLCEGVQ
jgi:hypothetical protein